MHLFGRFPPELSERLRDDEASKRGQLSRNCASFVELLRRPPHGSALVLGYVAVDEKAIVAATQRLAQALCA
jgi:hypothetical protein